MNKESLKYTKSHEWIEPEGAARKVGITDFAQDQLGDIVYVEFPASGRKVEAGDEVCVIESCKATASVYAPVSGTIRAYNNPLVDKPELINKAPFTDGWLFEIEPDGEDDASLLDLDTYEKTVAEH